MSNAYQYIRLGLADRVATVTLARAQAANALDFLLVQELKDALARAEADADVRVVVLKAEGGAFSTGLDLEFLRQLQQYGVEENLFDVNHLLELYLLLLRYKKVVIAQVEGEALGAGAALALAADICITTTDSEFGFPEARMGMIAGLAIPLLARKTGDAFARYLTLTGLPVNGARALQMGLVSMVVPAAEIEKTTAKTAADIANYMAPGAVELTKKLLADTVAMPLPEAFQFCARMSAYARITDEGVAGAQAGLAGKTVEW